MNIFQNNNFLTANNKDKLWDFILKKTAFG